MTGRAKTAPARSEQAQPVTGVDFHESQGRQGLPVSLALPSDEVFPGLAIRPSLQSGRSLAPPAGHKGELHGLQKFELTHQPIPAREAATAA